MNNLSDTSNPYIFLKEISSDGKAIQDAEY